MDSSARGVSLPLLILHCYKLRQICVRQVFPSVPFCPEDRFPEVGLLG